jgi:hypothetical protein
MPPAADASNRPLMVEEIQILDSSLFSYTQKLRGLNLVKSQERKKK